MFKNQFSFLQKCARNVSVVQPEPVMNRMNAWQVHSYGEDLQCSPIRVPTIKKPNDVLVKVCAASVNPIDTYMKDGYGRTFVKTFRCGDMVLPRTLGRDFSGVIIDKGHNVKDFQIGDKVYGVIPFYKEGTHAEYVIVNDTHLLEQPSNLSHVDAASIPYAALTAYSALWYTGGLNYRRTKGLKVLVLGASGGVGTYAVQMLESVGVTVIATCATDAVPLVQSLGVDCVLDYKDQNYILNVAAQGSYDIILDCIKMGYESIPESWQYSSYITLNSPLLEHTDRYGLLAGLACSAANIIPMNIRNLIKSRSIKWAYFSPSNEGLMFINKLVRSNQLIPVVDSVFNFNEMPAAYKRVQDGHLRGKIMVNYEE